MSIINLMLLGFLMEKPMNAYEIKKEVESRNVSRWIKGSSPSIYRNVNHLATKGYIDGKVMRNKGMPEKTVYTINERGKNHFNELMARYACTPPQTYLDFTAVIANLNKVDKAMGQQCIKELYASFLQTSRILHKVEDTFTPQQAKAIIQLSDKMHVLFCEWLKEFYEDYYKEPFSN